MSFWDMFSGGSSGGSGGGIFSNMGSSIWPAAIMAGSQLISNLFSPEYEYKDREVALAEQQQRDLQAYREQQLAQNLQLAQMDAAARAAAAGAQVRAAGIGAAAQNFATRQRADQAKFEGGLKQADILGSVGTQAGQMIGKAGDSELAAFDALVQRLQSPYALARRG